MTDDIVTRLRDECCCDDCRAVNDPCTRMRGADEIELLKNALALAVGELSTYGPYRYTSPEQLLQSFMQKKTFDD